MVISFDSLPAYVQLVINEHERWITTNGRYGRLGVLIEENLRFADLSGRNLGAMVLRRTCLASADLSNCDLTLADLTDADLSAANLKGAQLAGANFSGSRLVEALLGGAQFEPISLLRANGTPTGHWQETNLEKADLTGAELTGVDFSSCNMAGVIMD